ncbi:AB-hydrolase YheT [Flammula alnicola]|nr:AB-hydrolase YheT [Flammula alnicola]
MRRNTSRIPIVHFASNPALLQVNSRNDVDHVSLKALVETRCKSLFSEFRPLWWLFNGHLQTLYCIARDFSKDDPMWYHRTYLRLADGGTLGLDFAPADQARVKKDVPIIVVQHGLTGGSHEPYIRAILNRACASVEEGGLGYRAVVINFRGCAGVPVTSPLLYSAGHTDDTRTALMYIAHQYPDAPLVGLGFSLGSNVLTRYLGEEGDRSRLQSGCVLACSHVLRSMYSLLIISPPFFSSLVNSFTGRYLYSRGMGSNLVRLVKHHSDALMQDPEHEVAKATRIAITLKNPTMSKFDDTFTKIAGGPSPPFPFPDADTYYIWVSSHGMVQNIKVPFLSINSADDPVVRHVPMDGGGNGLVVMALTKNGGHLGWFQAGPGYVDRWTTKPVLEWLKVVGRDLVHDLKPRGLPLFTDNDGFLREKGRERLGCRVFEGGGLIDGNIVKYRVMQGL